ncbi:hypothetical protein THAOC_04053 [Thalassiosira oceanica]|uniref:Uncharacterized protein n=1 Tax=Thalassiosira oceanica TaxID=159749 RepID=K0T688_THAOC|nr:hypothetical protein THAOC_04053 [Thalassiosira oceanica]|eukprot:EJK74278.1 hypothetical protein THAOC_04053 [Thalassiosira oceanica]
MATALDKKELIRNDGWGKPKGGRKRKMNNDEISNYISTLKPGQSIGQKEVREAIVQTHKRRVIEAGGVPLQEAQVSHGTVINYKTEIAMNQMMSSTQCVTEKNRNRITAMGSFRGAVGMLGLIATTHFVSIEKEDPQIKKIVDNMSKDERWLYDYVCEKKRVVHTERKEEIRLVTKESVQNSGTLAYWKASDTKTHGGIRFDNTTTMAGAGCLLPFVTSVTGLNEREMPGCEFAAVKIPGFCLGGGGVDPGNKRPGWLTFSRDTPGAKTEKARWYIRDVFIPTLKEHRLENHNFDTSASSAIPAKLRAVASLDGDIPQLQAVKEELQLLADNGVTLNKGNPSRTLAEQACDLAVIFKLLHQRLPMRTMRHISVEDSPLKKTLFDAFEFGELATILNLPYTKRETIVDYILCYLSVMTEIASTHNVKAGFIDNGSLDPTHERIPTLDGILATCKRDITLEEKRNVIDNFDKIFDSFEKHGCMPESVHDEVGIADDVDPNGKVVRREADANSEHLQRCKCMNHPQVINERHELQRKSNSKQLESMEKVNAKFLEKVQSYNNSIQKIRGLLRDEGLGSENECDRDESFIEECTLEHFGKLTVDSLKAFIFGRNPISGKAPNKGTVDGAKNGDRNLIRLAYECKAMPNKHALLSKRPYSNEDLQKYRENISSLLRFSETISGAI